MEDTIVVKAAKDPDDGDRLGREAELLRTFAHPGIVRLIASTPGREIRLHRETAGTLASLPVGSALTEVGWGAAVASTLADLHEMGLVHRAVAEDHILLDPGGRPVLCGFGSATDRPPVDPYVDVAALCTLLERRLPGGERRLARLLRRGQQGRLTARQLADGLVSAVPSACLPSVEATTDTAPSAVTESSHAGGCTRSNGVEVRPFLAPARAPRSLALSVAVAAVAAAVWLALPLLDGPHNRPAGTAEPVHGPAGVYTLESSPGQETEAVTAAWDCGPPLPAVLDRRTGEIWVFSAWPVAGGSVRASPVTVVAGARSIAPVEIGLCKEIGVQRDGRPPIALDPGRALALGAAGRS